MKFEKTSLRDAYTITLETISDKRGKFTRLFDQKELAMAGFKKKIVQVNYTFSKKSGTLRGLHLQTEPYAETKIVSCIKGKVFDVIVDLRQNSPTFLKWHGEILSDKNHKMIYIPEGFAHGLQALTKNCGMLYFHSNFYQKTHEKGIRYNDPLIGIKWKLKVTEISDKDKNNPYLKKSFRGFKI